MKTKQLILTLAAAAVLFTAGAGLYQLGRQQDSDAPAVPAAAGNEKKPLYWHDPMVPGQRFDKPGKSPFMDMQLVPVYADDSGGEAAVRIDPQVQQNLGMRTAEVTRGSFARTFSVVGNVAYNERDVALVQARSSGYIERLFVRAPLDPVHAGQPLAELYAPDWVAAQEEFLAARRIQGIAGLADAARQRMRLAGMSEAQIHIVETSGKVHARTTITAPRDGVVSELTAREGMTVTAGAALFRINGKASVWINADVPETLAAQLQPGTAAEARTAALPGKVYSGRVSAELPQVDAGTRTLTARIEVRNPDGLLVPGMFAQVIFAGAERADVLTVPSESVIRTGTRSLVMLALPKGGFRPVEVETGQEMDGRTEVLRGLEAGQKVVASGQFLIDSEASLKGVTAHTGTAPAAAGAEAAPTHHGQGKVEQVANGEITISHGPIASLQWDAMTMPFAAPVSGLPRNVAVGDSVSFDFRAGPDGSFQITSITPLADIPTGKVAKGGKR